VHGPFLKGGIVVVAWRDDHIVVVAHAWVWANTLEPPAMSDANDQTVSLEPLRNAVTHQSLSNKRTRPGPLSHGTTCVQSLRLLRWARGCVHMVPISVWGANRQ
jgi:hypothetical protein